MRSESESEHKTKSYEYLTKHKLFSKEIIRKRHSTWFSTLQKLLDELGMNNCCEINQDLLNQAILDYFADVARLKEFHDIERIAVEKIYSYSAFWCLRNHPIQIVDSGILRQKHKEFVHVNEKIIAYWVVQNIATELESVFATDIQIDNLKNKLLNHELLVDFREDLYYSFRYRQYTPQSILLSIEAFMNAAMLILQIT